MDVFTVILVPEGQGRVRRYRVRRRSVTTLLGGVAFGVVALVAVARFSASDGAEVARLDGEVARLEAEVAAHEAGARGYASRAAEIEAELDRLREFERRVRVIANLPSGHGEADALDPSGQAPGTAGGMGGLSSATERPEDAAPPLGTPISAAAEPSSPDAEGSEERADTERTETPPPVSAAAPDAALGNGGPTPWASLGAAAERIHERLRRRGTALRELVEALHGKAEQLAATPSILPTQGWITSRFGWRISPFTGRRDFHEGVDLAAEFGTPIVAPARGRVVFAGTKGGLGRSVVIRHDNRIETTYGHARELHVKAGQRVERGDVIATVGSTGRSTGPHLHYGVELAGRWVNPLDYVVD